MSSPEEAIAKLRAFNVGNLMMCIVATVVAVTMGVAYLYARKTHQVDIWELLLLLFCLMLTILLSADHYIANRRLIKSLKEHKPDECTRQV